MAAYFQFEQKNPNNERKTFIFKLINDMTIHSAREILNGHEVERVHIQGTIVPRRVPYNPEWSFHIDPETVGFFFMQIEVCDANVSYVEDHLDEIGGSTLPRNFWCPWSSKLIAEVTNQIDPITEKLHSLDTP